MSYIKQFEYGFVDDCSLHQAKLSPGFYLIQAWGASGGGKTEYGKGAYVEGEIFLPYKTVFYISVGGHGKDPNNSTGAEKSCGGGGAGGNGNWYEGKMTGGGYGGGGSTDIRTNENISSRILVAAGGGGNSGNVGNGGHGGGIESKKVICDNKIDYSAPANQTSGFSLFDGEDGRNGTKGVGTGAEGNGGGGGGFYGGYSTRSTNNHSSCGGAGGSSYISGHPQCQKQYYSFNKFDIKDGSNSSIEPHPGVNDRDGYVIITLLKSTITGNLFILLSIKIFLLSLTFPTVVS